MAIVAMRRSQIGVEATVGAAVAPSRQLQGVLSLENASEREVRDERRASMGGSLAWTEFATGSTGSYTGRVTADELVYFLSACIGYNAPTGGTWVFDQPLTRLELEAQPLKSLTCYAGEILAGAEDASFRAAGMFVERLQISGQDRTSWQAQYDLIGRELVHATTTVPVPTAVLLESLGTPNMPTIQTLMTTFATSTSSTGYSPLSNTVFSFTFTFTSGIVQEYTMGTSLDPTGIQRDIPTATLEIIAKLTKTVADEYLYHDNLVTRFVKIDGGGVQIEGAYKVTGFVPLDSERDGTLLARITYTAVEDQTWNSKIKITVASSVAPGPADDESAEPETASTRRKKAA